MASLRQPIVFRFAPVLRFAPERGEPTLFFHLVQRQEVRSGAYLKGLARDQLDTSSYTKPMQFAIPNSFEDEKSESALKNIRWYRRHADIPIGWRDEHRSLTPECQQAKLWLWNGPPPRTSKPAGCR